MGIGGVADQFMRVAPKTSGKVSIKIARGNGEGEGGAFAGRRVQAKVATVLHDAFLNVGQSQTGALAFFCAEERLEDAVLDF